MLEQKPTRNIRSLDFFILVSYYVTGYYVTNSCQSESRAHTKNGQRWHKNLVKGSS